MLETYKAQFRTMGDYNGWTNYPTWLVALWLDNDQGAYLYWREIAEKLLNNVESEDDMKDAIYELEERLKNEIIDNNPLSGDASMYSDLLSWAMEYINWREIAEHMLET